MGKRGGGFGSMAERVARSRDEGARPPAASSGPPIKHCWVLGAHGRVPGLLLEWRRVAGTWRGRVVHPVPDGAGWVVVEEWVDAGLLERG